MTELPVGTTYREIDGRLCRCMDTGCDDFARAARNRVIIKDKLLIEAYLIIEQLVARTPPNKKLASWIPLGTPPQVDRRIWQGHSGGEGGLHEEIEEIVVGLDN